MFACLNNFLMLESERASLSAVEMADIFGISVSRFKNYLTGNQTIPIAMQLACAAMRRDRTVQSARFRPRVAGRPRKSVGV